MKLPKILTSVTTFSKILAMIFFILFPFIGFYLGMRYQQLVDLLSLQTSEINSYPVISNSHTPVNLPKTNPNRMIIPGAGTFTFGDIDQKKATESIYFLSGDGTRKSPIKIMGDANIYSDFRNVQFSPSGQYFTFQLLGPGDEIAYYLAKSDGLSTKSLSLNKLAPGYWFSITGWFDDKTILIEGTPVYNTDVPVKHWKMDVANLSSLIPVNL